MVVDYLNVVSISIFNARFLSRSISSAISRRAFSSTSYFSLSNFSFKESLFISNKTITEITGSNFSSAISFQIPMAFLFPARNCTRKLVSIHTLAFITSIPLLPFLLQFFYFFESHFNCCSRKGILFCNLKNFSGSFLLSFEQ